MSQFGLPVLDTLLRNITEARALSPKTQPIVELMSLLPGDGKTHIIYHLAAISVLPKVLGGQQAAVVLLDTDCSFSVPLLAQQIQRIAAAKQPESNNIDTLVTQSLKHVHIFRPQSLLSTIANVRSLQTYLFNPTLHYSFDRPIGFIALDSASAFYWQARAETEDAALLASTSNNNTKPSDYVQLAAVLKNASRILNAPIVFTTWYLGPSKKPGADANSFRPSLPPPWQSLATLRLVVKRAEVRKLPMEISVVEATRESQLRQKVVDVGKFECFVNEWGLEERIVRKLQEGRTGFEFFVTAEGVRIAEVDGL